MKYFILLLAVSFNAYAAGKGHAPQNWEEFLKSLIWPLFNVTVLGSLLFWKLKNPVKSFFLNKSESISQIMERANVKAKEAEMMMQMQRKKLEGMEEEVARIRKDADSEIEKFKSTYSRSVEERIEALKTDAAAKISAEKKQLTDSLNSMLLDEVISKAKHTLKTNKQLNESATSRALEGLR